MSRGIGLAELICSPPQDAARRGVPRLEGSMRTFMMVSKQAALGHEASKPQGIDDLVRIARVSLGSHSDIFSEATHCLIIRELYCVQLPNAVLLRDDQEVVHEQLRKLGVLPFIRNRDRHFAGVRLPTGSVATNSDLDFTTFIPHCRDEGHGVRTINIAKSTDLGR